MNLYYLSQILTTLNLENNNIDDRGAQYLANALKTNTVRIFICSSLSYSSLPFKIDTHHTMSISQ